VLLKLTAGTVDSEAKMWFLHSCAVKEAELVRLSGLNS